jgi:hypothetical protein
MCHLKPVPITGDIMHCNLLFFSFPDFDFFTQSSSKTSKIAADGNFSGKIAMA